MRRKVVIMGAAGKDFHVFNTCYRGDKNFEVVAFTAAQIPNIDNRVYPAVLAGELYPQGIEILPEKELVNIIIKHGVNDVVFAYSDVSYDYIDQRRRIVEAAGARFMLSDPQRTMLKSSKTVVAVCAVRTGAGKSPTTRRVVSILREKGKRVVVVRHPMPYGDLARQEVQRFETLDDLVRHNCTIEEMEEYEPHLTRGVTVFAGVDYEKILREAEKTADVVVWDGGNNDTPFFRPDVYITVADPLRAGHELTHYPGRLNFENADAIVISKVDTARPEDVEKVLMNVRQYNKKAVVVRARCPISVSNPDIIKGMRVLCIEDGPTVTHGDMKLGAGVLAARAHGAAEIVDPRPFAVRSIAETFKSYPEIGQLLPAMGYGKEQIEDLQETINRCDCDVVVVATPVDLTRLLKIQKPTVRVSYEIEELGQPTLKTVLAKI